MLRGLIEADETYVGGRPRKRNSAMTTSPTPEDEDRSDIFGPTRLSHGLLGQIEQFSIPVPFQEAIVIG